MEFFTQPKECERAHHKQAFTAKGSVVVTLMGGRDFRSGGSTQPSPFAQELHISSRVTVRILQAPGHYLGFWLSDEQRKRELMGLPGWVLSFSALSPSKPLILGGERKEEGGGQRTTLEEEEGEGCGQADAPGQNPPNWRRRRKGRG